MKVKPTLTVNLHCEEGRAMFQLDLESFNSAEREFMVRAFKRAEEGASFVVDQTEDGRQCMKFTLGKLVTVN